MMCYHCSFNMPPLWLKSATVLAYNKCANIVALICYHCSLNVPPVWLCCATVVALVYHHCGFDVLLL